MIEEAAGLGKHRKRRRRAQLKLERTEENLSRSLDVEREARSRLRPLKRQAEAAELHERIERQSLEARMTLTADAARSTRAALAEAEVRARDAAAERDEAERLLGEVARRREAAEAAFAAHNSRREQIQSRRFDAGSAADRIQMRLERVRDQGSAAEDRGRRRESQLELMEAEAAHLAEEGEQMPDERLPEPPRQGDGGEAWDVLVPAERVRALERELSRLDAKADERRAEELTGLESELEETRGTLAALEQAAAERREALQAAEHSADEARAARREAERAVEAARAEAAEAGSQLAALNRLVRGAAGTAEGGGPGLVEGITAEAGYEPALAAALGSRLTAAVVEDLAQGEQLLDRSEERGGTALVSSRAHGRPVGQAPAPGASRLLTHVRPEQRVAKLADRLLGDVWVVDSLKSVSGSFRGVAVTRGGRLLDGATGELSQAPPGGGERLLEELGRREGIVAASERAVASEREAAFQRRARGRGDRHGGRQPARRQRSRVRAAGRELAEAAETAERLGWLLERRREAPGEGPDTVRRAELAADLRAERHLAERAERERAGRLRSLATLRAGIEADRDMVRAAARVTAALEAALAAVEAQRDALAEELGRRRRHRRGDGLRPPGVRPGGGRPPRTAEARKRRGDHRGGHRPAGP